MVHRSVTPLGHTGSMAADSRAPIPARPGASGPSPARFAEIALTGLAALGPGPEIRPGLALELGLSAWMRLGGVGTEEARDTLVALRAALVAEAGLEAEREPVPFIGRDPRSDTLTLAAYLGDLLPRALRASGTDRAHLVAGAVERLGS